jgi:hypothetical protein
MAILSWPLIVEGFRRALDPATVSGAADLLRAIENAPAILQGRLPADRLGIRALDAYSLEIRLSHPVPYFPDILTNTVASPAPLLINRPKRVLNACNGFKWAYELAAFSPGAHLRLAHPITGTRPVVLTR